MRIAQGSRLAGLLRKDEATDQGAVPQAQVNSSHHQAIRVPGDKLLVSAVSPRDGVIEAVELDAPEHFVVAVQWHPERTYAESGLSRAIFAAFVESAAGWQPPKVTESTGASASKT